MAETMNEWKREQGDITRSDGLTLIYDARSHTYAVMWRRSDGEKFALGGELTPLRFDGTNAQAVMDWCDDHLPLGGDFSNAKVPAPPWRG